MQQDHVDDVVAVEVAGSAMNVLFAVVVIEFAEDEIIPIVRQPVNARADSLMSARL